MTDKRTKPQQDAMEVYFKEISAMLNDAGYDQVAVLEKKALPVENTPEFIKEIWKCAQKVMYPPDEGKNVSTTALKTEQVSKVHRVVDLYFSKNFGISLPFPSNEEEMLNNGE